MSLNFGVYVSIVGVAVVFITLLIVAASIMVMRRLIGGGIETTVTESRSKKQVAAVSAIFYYLDLEEHASPRIRVLEGQSNWSKVARVESLRVGVSDEA